MTRASQCALFGLLLLATRLSGEPESTVVVLPLQVGAGLTAQEAHIGFGIQSLLENALILDANSWDRWALSYYRLLFPKAEELDAWAAGHVAKPPPLDSLKCRYVVLGRVVRKDNAVIANLQIRDRLSKRTVSRSIKLDPPKLIRLRVGFFELLAKMGHKIPPARRPDMLWEENLSVPAMASLGEGLWRDVRAMEFGGDKYSVDATPLQETLRLAPDSYLLLDAFGFVQYRNGERAGARASLERAVQANPHGIDALDGLLDLALDAHDMAAAERYAERKALARGLDTHLELARLQDRLGDHAFTAEDYKEAAIHYLEARRLWPKDARYHTDLAAAYQRLKQFDEARLVLEGAVSAVQSDPDRTRIFAALAALRYQLGEDRFEKEDYLNAVAQYQSAYELDTRYRPSGAAQDLLSIGRCYLKLRQYDRSADFFQKSADLFRQRNDRGNELNALLYASLSKLRLEQWDKAIALVRQVLAYCRAEKEGTCMPTVLDFLAQAYSGLRQYDRAAEFYQELLALGRKANDRSLEADTLGRLGLVYSRMNEHEKAIEVYRQQLATERLRKDRAGEAEALRSVGGAHGSLDQLDTAVSYMEQALVIFRELHDRPNEALTLKLAGFYCYKLDRWTMAIADMQEALTIDEELKDRGEQASVLNNLGEVYERLSQFEKAIGFFERALPVFQELKDGIGEASALNNLGLAYSNLSRFEKAIPYYGRALAVCRELRDPKCESSAVNNLASEHQALGQFEKAAALFEQALALDRQVRNRRGEATVLNNLGVVYESLHQYEKAILNFQQALPLRRETQDRQGEGLTLHSLSVAFYAQGKYQAAMESARQAVAIYREVRDRQAEGTALGVLAGVYFKLKQFEQALAYGQQALAMLHEVKDRKREANALATLMQIWAGMNKTELAIFYGKEAVNQYQEIRGQIQAFDKASSQTFVQSESATYRKLADLLASVGRLAEARQVLDLLKEEEYFAFVRRDAAVASPAGRVDLSPGEAVWQKRYREIADRIGAIGSDRATLLAKARRTAAEEDQLNGLEDDLSVAGRGFQQYLRDLATELGASQPATERMFELRETQGLMGLLRQLGHGSVIIYTLITEEKYRAILITPDTQKGFEYDISQADLNRKILDFHQALRNPSVDPRPLGKELYKIVVGPLAKDLEGAHAETLMWSLDGALRYLPVSALYDGQQYLVERYRSAIFTPASRDRLREQPGERWKALGLGVSKPYGDFPSLPNVPAELRSIVRDPLSPGDGVLDGVIELDEAFTWNAMRAALRQRYAVVHIASHFQFQPGNDANSFLLLGGGEELRLDQISASSGLFENVELLTLSACNTGMGDGTEVEGFGTLAQRQGAKAVIASLWEVSDASTSVLMQELYRIRESHAGMTKLEALQQAQLALLRGTVHASQGAAGRSLVHDPPKAPTEGIAPIPFPFRAESPYAHPYYWAPFFLMGNWL